MTPATNALVNKRFHEEPTMGRNWPISESDGAALIAHARKLESALRDLLDQVESLNGYELTRDVEPYKAQACWDDAIDRARDALA
jgi:hypothetical protein